MITLVLYYGEELWDGSMDLYGMFQAKGIIRKNPVLQRYIPNYEINLVEPGNMKSFEKFRTDLQEIFGMLRYRSNKTKLKNYMNDREEYFRNVDEETYYVIREFLHSERVMKTINKKNGEEKVDMCQALEELYNDGVEAGKEVGMEVGMEKGRLYAAKNLLDILDVETIAEKVGLPLEVILKLKNEV